MNRGILIVLSGFSGAGKGTLMKELMKTYDNYALSVSMTTRSPRQGEINGREYFFSTRETFEEKIAQNGLIEYAEYCAIIMERRGIMWKSSLQKERMSS